ncbi:hypothetical protein FNH63_15275 [Salmonella enterica subsp. salamae]|nr:hypothetical protein [Salmonella enterica]ECJ5918847.1 hypothetical protein [Salmonella enterica subsp. salamae]EAX8554852.1 hypothetical protein [Salmonella enterica]EAX8594810.1 hypothetical protein [Salmonella enterica]EAX8617276.1 hypothetical protein [Salmonella enterica]
MLYLLPIFSLHTSRHRCIGCLSPQSLTTVSSWGFAALPPSCDANYFGKILILFIMNLPDPTSPIYPRFLQ